MIRYPSTLSTDFLSEFPALRRLSHRPNKLDSQVLPDRLKHLPALLASGRDFRLTDVADVVAKKVIA